MSDSPGIVWMRPVFHAVEQAGTWWRFLGCSPEPTPQQARDALADQFLLRAAWAAAGSRACEDYSQAAGLLERERHDQLTVAGHRFAIARVEQFLRMGPDGPEPPRPGDSRPLGTPAGALVAPGFARVVLPGACFAIGERTDDGWAQPMMREYETPERARAALIAYLREYVPRPGDPAQGVPAAFAKAADGLARHHVNELSAAGRRLRIMRVGQVVCLSAEGPEPPRPSDADPRLPRAAGTRAPS
jgi:hypothetical protein